MPDYPPVIALIVTYRRLPLALATVRSVKASVVYPNIGFHIADDGSGPEYIQRIADEIGSEYSITVSDAARGGVGKSMNMGIAACLERADYWLHLEDDWVLPKPFDLTPSIQLLAEDTSIGMVRLGRLTAGLKVTTFSDTRRIWFRILKNCDPYVFSGNPSLRHRRFHEAYGGYPEDRSPGLTEMEYCSKFNNTPGSDIAVQSLDDVFQHIGDSQSFKWWQEAGGKSAEEAAAIFEEMDREARV